VEYLCENYAWVSLAWGWGHEPAQYQ